MSHYTMYNLSSGAQRSSLALFGTLATVSEALLFVLIGAASVDYVAMKAAWDGAFASLAMPVLLVARAATIFPLCALVNLCRRPAKGARRQKTSRRISPRMQVVMWWSGLKGAVSFALAMTLNDSRASHMVLPTKKAKHLVTTTLVCVLFTNLIVAPLTGPLLRRLRLHTGQTATYQGQGTLGAMPTGSTPPLSAALNGDGGGDTMPLPLLNDSDQTGGGAVVDCGVRWSRLHALRPTAHASRPIHVPHSSCLCMRVHHAPHICPLRVPHVQVGDADGTQWGVHAVWRRLDEIYIKPVFGGRGADGCMLDLEVERE